MKKFVFLYVGVDTPTAERKQAWGKWFASVGDKFVDSGSPFSPGKEITTTGTRDLSHDKNAITGYSMISAESIEEAEKIAKSCPMVTGVRVYEAMVM